MRCCSLAQKCVFRNWQRQNKHDTSIVSSFHVILTRSFSPINLNSFVLKLRLLVVAIIRVCSAITALAIFGVIRVRTP